MANISPLIFKKIIKLFLQLSDKQSNKEKGGITMYKKVLLAICFIVCSYWIVKIAYEVEAKKQMIEELKNQREKENEEMISLKEGIENFKKDLGLNEKAVQVFDSYFKGTVLEGHGVDVMLSAKSQEPKVSASLMVAIILLECGRELKSSNLLNNNNVSGMNYTIDSQYKKNGWYVNYPSIEASIEDLAYRLSKYYIKEGRTTIESIGEKYAPVSDPRNHQHGMNNNKWVHNVTMYYNEIISKIES